MDSGHNRFVISVQVGHSHLKSCHRDATRRRPRYSHPREIVTVDGRELVAAELVAQAATANGIVAAAVGFQEQSQISAVAE